MVEGIKDILSNLYNVLIIAGLSWQVYEVSKLFFKFDVLTHLDINFDEVINTPDMSVCIKYYDVLDIEKFNSMTSSKLSPDAIGKDRRLQDDEVQSKITIKELFDMTPSEGQSMDACFYRDAETYQFDYYNSSVYCYQHFNVEKYSFMDAICYRYSHPINGDANQSMNMIYDKKSIVFSPDDPGVIFAVRLSRLLNRSERFRIMAHPAGTFPWIEAAYTSEISRLGDAHDKDMNQILFSVTSSMIHVKKLPRPYRTRCRKYQNEGFIDVYTCRQRCFRNKTVRAFGKVPFNSRIKNAINLKRVCAKDMHEEEFRRALNKHHFDCINQCSDDDCNQIITMTDAERHEYEYLQFEYRTPIDPSLELTFNPRLSLIEYLVYVTSCFGIWLGVSFYQFNPFKTDFMNSLKRIKIIDDVINIRKKKINDMKKRIERKKSESFHISLFQRHAEYVNKNHVHRRDVTRNHSL